MMKKRGHFVIEALLLVLFWTTGAWAQNSLEPKIAFQNTTFDAGEILEGDPIEHSFKVFNRGESTLKIIRVNPG